MPEYCGERQSSRSLAPCELRQATLAYRFCLQLSEAKLPVQGSTRSLQDDDVQLMRTVHSAYQEAHVSGSAGTGDKNKVSLQSFAVQEVWAEEVAWSFRDFVGGKYCNVHAGEQAYDT